MKLMVIFKAIAFPPRIKAKKKRLTRSILHSKKAEKHKITMTQRLGNCSHQGTALSKSSSLEMTSFSESPSLTNSLRESAISLTSAYTFPLLLLLLPSVDERREKWQLWGELTGARNRHRVGLGLVLVEMVSGGDLGKLEEKRRALKLMATFLSFTSSQRQGRD